MLSHHATGLRLFCLRISGGLIRGRQPDIYRCGDTEHIDTLSSILYLSPEFYAAMQRTGSFVDEALDEVGSGLTQEELAEVKTDLYIHLGKITEKWYLKIKKLKDDYDATFTEGN